MHRSLLILALCAAVSLICRSPSARAQIGSDWDVLDRLEQQADETDVDARTLEDMQSLLEQPIDLNQAARQELEILPGVDRSLAERLIRYRSANGPFRDWDAVRHALGGHARILEDMRPLVTIGSPSPEPARSTRRPRKGRRTAYVTSQWYVRRDQQMHYTGAPTPVSETRRATTRIVIRGPRGPGGRLTLTRGDTPAAMRIGGGELRMLDGNVALVAGAYAAEFGAGLLLKRGGVRDPWRTARGAPLVRRVAITPRSSASADDHFSGVSLQVTAAKRWTATGMYSRRIRRDILQEVTAGTVERTSSRLAVGLAVLQVRFGPERPLGQRLHERRRFAGERYRVASVYVDLEGEYQRLSFELAGAAPHAGAFIGSFQSQLSEQAQLVVAYRDLASQFPLPFARPNLVTAGDGVGERGLMLAGSAAHGAWRLQFLIDGAVPYWASTASAWPSPGIDARLQLERRIGGRILFFQLRRQRLPEDSAVVDRADERRVRASGFQQRLSGRVQSDLPLGRSVALRVRLEGVRVVEPAGERSTGTLLYQQIRYRPVQAILFEFRSLMFVTGSTAARVYVHETDVLYQPMLSVFSGDGFRRYVRARIDVGPHLVVEAKIGRTRRSYMSESAGEPPLREHRTEFRLQIRIAR